MLFKTNSGRAAWRVFTVLLAAISCVCFFFGGAFFQSVPAGQFDQGYTRYFCMLIALISSSLLLAIGGTAVDTKANYRPVVVAGMVFAAAASAILAVGDVLSCFEAGAMAPSGSFNNLTYLVVDIALLVATIVLACFFLGKAGKKAASISALFFLGGNVLFMIGVFLHFANGSAFDEQSSAWFNLIYPWVDAMGLGATVVPFVLVRKSQNRGTATD